MLWNVRGPFRNTTAAEITVSAEKPMKVAEAMITNPLCCTATCTAQIVASLMQQVEYGLIPVLEKFSRHMVGAITDRDLCLRVLAEGRNAAQTSVSECMTAQPICCKPDEDGGDVLRGVITCGLRGVVVVNEAGELEGVVSTASLAKKLSVPFDTEAQPLPLSMAGGPSRT